MAITRISAPHTLWTSINGAGIVPDTGKFELTRMEDGRIAAVFATTNQTTGIDSYRVSYVDATNTAHTAPQFVGGSTATTDINRPTGVATLNGNFLVGWENYVEDDFPSDVLIRTFSSAGTALTNQSFMSTGAGTEFNPSLVRLGNGNVLATWTDSRNSPTNLSIDLDVMGRIYSPAGTALTGEFVVNSSGAGVQLESSSVALSDGRTVVTWVNGTIVDGGGGNPEPVPAGVNGRLLSAAGALTGVDFAIDTVNTGYRYEDLQSVVLGDGSFVVVWQQHNAAGNHQIHFQRMLAPAGGTSAVKVGGEVTVTNHNGEMDAVDVVGLANGGFAIHWWTFAPTQPAQDHTVAYNMFGGLIQSDVSLTTISTTGGPGLSLPSDMELMADGRVMVLGVANATSTVGTQVFDFGDERMFGTNNADTRYGKNGVNDQIFGLGGNDTLLGLSGRDTIDGGLGNDILSGGIGLDTFKFTTALSSGLNRDTITDFFVPHDTIQLENAIFLGLGAATGVLAANKFWSSATGLAHDADDRIIYNTTNGVLTYDANGSAAGGIIQFAVLSTKPTGVTNADFVVI